jgi:hypothetical protein
VAQAQEPAEPPGEEEPGGETAEPGAPPNGTAAAPGQAPTPQKRRPRTEEPDEEGPEPPLVVPAPDQLSGHFQLSPMAGVAVPFSNLERNTPQRETMGDGFMFGADLGYGISRVVALGLWGQYLTLDNGRNCKDCSTQSTAAGAFVRYHLVQGVRFDPWMAAGLGFRQTKISSSGADTTYSGIEWLRLQVGGDWYPFSNVGFGPFMELDFGRYSKRSPGPIGDQANHWHFLTGFRVTLDIPGK